MKEAVFASGQKLMGELMRMYESTVLERKQFWKKDLKVKRFLLLRTDHQHHKIDRQSIGRRPFERRNRTGQNRLQLRATFHARVRHGQPLPKTGGTNLLPSLHPREQIFKIQFRR